MEYSSIATVRAISTTDTCLFRYMLRYKAVSQPTSPPPRMAIRWPRSSPRSPIS